MPVPPRSILSISLNPAWQRTIHFPDVTVGSVNRADWVRESVGGKGVNFARALRFLPTPVTILQFAGGHTGRLLCGELDRLGLPHVTVPTGAKTRVCSTVIAAGDSTVTELIEPSEPVTPQEMERLRRRSHQELEPLSGVALCGTCPPGVPDTFYAEVARCARRQAVVLLDGYKGIESVLEAGVDILKVNADELCALTGTSELRAAVEVCLAEYSVRFLGVTAGPAPALLASKGQGWSFTLPAVSHFVNAIGAGDTTSAVFLAELVAKLPEPDATADSSCFAVDSLSPADVCQAFARALACGSASCLEPLPAEFDRAKAEEILDQIRVRPLPWTVS